MAQRIVINPNQIGLIVRGMLNPDHDPSVLAQHADCILPDGTPIGFFGEGPARTGEGAGSGSSMRLGMNMRGVVYDYARMARERPFYVDANDAKLNGVVSTVLIIDTTTDAAKRFAEYWRVKKLSPGGFSLLGNNCSTNASEGFEAAAIVTGGIPGLDTPVHLFRQLLASCSKAATYSGHVGFVKRADGLPGFDVVIE